jgi:hypothetical protein
VGRILSQKRRNQQEGIPPICHESRRMTHDVMNPRSDDFRTDSPTSFNLKCLLIGNGVQYPDAVYQAVREQARFALS